MASLLTKIQRYFQRRQARKQLEKWKRHHSHVNGIIVSHKFELADIYADLYWYATFNGVKREIMYQRHTLGGMKKQIVHDEEDLLPSRVASLQKG